MRFIKALFCFILCAFLLVGCSAEGVSDMLNSAADAVLPVKLTGEIHEVTFTPQDSMPVTEFEFDKISFSSKNAKINIIPSDETKVVARYPADLEKHGFAINIRDGEIWVSVPKQKNFTAEEFTLDVYANISEIKIYGGIEMDIDAKGIKRLEIEINGASSLYVHEVEANAVYLDVKGASAADISGSVGSFEASIKGAGTIEAKSLVCETAEIKISGAGSANVSVTDTLTADIDGVGALSYYGSPEVKNLSSGLSAVEQASKEIYGK